MKNRTKDKNEPVWALCDFILQAPNKHVAEIRFENCAVLCQKDEWAIRVLAETMNNYSPIPDIGEWQNTMGTKSPVGLLRQASILLKKEKHQGWENLTIAEQDNGKYPMNIKPGDYKTEKVSKAIHFLADMLE